jgi:hypothetical protein
MSCTIHETEGFTLSDAARAHLMEPAIVPQTTGQIALDLATRLSSVLRDCLSCEQRTQCPRLGAVAKPVDKTLCAAPAREQAHAHGRAPRQRIFHDHARQ